MDAWRKSPVRWFSLEFSEYMLRHRTLPNTVASNHLDANIRWLFSFRVVGKAFIPYGM